jgi:hypothetical protein
MIFLTCDPAMNIPPWGIISNNESKGDGEWIHLKIGCANIRTT